MRSLLLVLVLANFLFFATQLDVFGNVLHESHDAGRIAQLNAERLRIVRDTSVRPAPAVPSTSATPALVP